MSTMKERQAARERRTRTTRLSPFGWSRLEPVDMPEVSEKQLDETEAPVLLFQEAVNSSPEEIRERFEQNCLYTH